MNAQNTKQDPADDPKELPYPGYAREVAAMQRKIAEATAARGEPLPGASRAAFAGEPRKLHGFTFQPVTGWQVAILKRIDSPILDILKIYRSHAAELTAAAENPNEKAREKECAKLLKTIQAEILKKVAPEANAAIETVFAFVTDPEKCQDLLDNGRGHFTRAAQKVIGKLHPNILADLERACGEHYMESFSTALSVSPVPQEGSDEMVFTQPPARTDLAGGSK
jgi:hypothetical protein